MNCYSITLKQPKPSYIMINPFLKRRRIPLSQPGNDFLLDKNNHMWQRYSYKLFDKISKALAIRP